MEDIKYLIDKERLKKLTTSLLHSNKICMELYKKYKIYFRQYKYADISISEITSGIVYHINEVIRHITYLHTSIKPLLSGKKDSTLN